MKLSLNYLRCYEGNSDLESLIQLHSLKSLRIKIQFNRLKNLNSVIKCFFLKVCVNSDNQIIEKAFYYEYTGHFIVGDIKKNKKREKGVFLPLKRTDTYKG